MNEFLHSRTGIEAAQYMFVSLPSEQTYEPPSKKPSLFYERSEIK